MTRPTRRIDAMRRPRSLLRIRIRAGLSVLGTTVVRPGDTFNVGVPQLASHGRKIPKRRVTKQSGGKCQLGLMVFAKRRRITLGRKFRSDLTLRKWHSVKGLG